MPLAKKIAFARAQLRFLMRQMAHTMDRKRLLALQADYMQWWDELAKLVGSNNGL